MHKQNVKINVNGVTEASRICKTSSVPVTMLSIVILKTIYIIKLNIKL